MLPVHCQHVVTGVSITKFVIAAVEPNFGVEGYQTLELDRSSGPFVMVEMLESMEIEA